MYKDKNIKNILFIITVSVICLSILLLIVLHNRTNTIFQSIVVWLILYIISHWCLKSLPLAIFTSVILVLLLTFVRCNNNVTENFEDEDKKDEDKKDEDKKDEDKKDEDKKDEDEILKGRTNVVRNIENKKGDMSDDLGLSEISKMLEGLEDEKEDEKGLKSTSDGNAKLGASGAQRETFRLINTVNELDKTLKALSPTLNQGKNIIEMMKKLNL
jgi:hypothetical protein